MSNNRESQPLTEEARAAQRAYFKRWRATHKDKVREYNLRYWQKLVTRLDEEGGDKDDAQG